MFAAFRAASSSGLLSDSVLVDIPHDTGAIIIYALLVVVAVFMWFGSRKEPS